MRVAIDHVKTLGMRAAVDLAGAALVVGLVYLGLCAYHGEQAYQYLNRAILAAQAAQQQKAQPGPTSAGK